MCFTWLGIPAHSPCTNLILTCIKTVFMKILSDPKPYGPVNHENSQAQILFRWPRQIWGWTSLLFFFFQTQFNSSKYHSLVYDSNKKLMWSSGFLHYQSDGCLYQQKRIKRFKDQVNLAEMEGLGTSLYNSIAYVVSKTWRYLR